MEDSFCREAKGHPLETIAISNGAFSGPCLCCFYWVSLSVACLRRNWL